MNKYRKFITSAVGFTFVVVAVTGVIFKLFFKTRPLEQIHGWLGLAMVAAAVFHILQNWAPLRNHFRDRRVFALLIPIVAVVVAMYAFAPAGGSRGGKAGEGRRGDDRGRGPNTRVFMDKLSQAHITDVAKALGADTTAVFTSMKADGLTIGAGDQTVQQLAQDNHKSPEGILLYFVK